MTSPLTALQPEGWPAPRGYANGMMGRGRVVLVGGQIGWDSEGRFPPGLVAQTRQALENVLAVVRAAGGGPEHIGRLTWYVVDMAEYRASQKELGPAYREVMGRHYPAMALVQVVCLVEPAARVEIEATAIIPD
ncbi:RidA family protein [Falsiroseomonas sp.]|uniref:RidA family protein n=1 Tax=Falsiroseomonas sp. TaxID=2870721 RepID=UPI003569689E